MMQLNELEFWIDLNLPPKMANWLVEGFNVNAKSFKELLFEDVPDVEVYKIAASKSNMVIITTKDIDFSNYQNVVGAPPRILYLNIGNISNKNLKLLIEERFAEILQLFLTTNEPLIEISTE
jgi:predicted nuclease of predicted toxin-antitoxin system